MQWHKRSKLNWILVNVDVDAHIDAHFFHLNFTKVHDECLIWH